jgi:hypothetical protein
MKRDMTKVGLDSEKLVNTDFDPFVNIPNQTTPSDRRKIVAKKYNKYGSRT